MSDQTERFCSYCGKSRVPLDIPHVARDCVQCGKTTYLVEHSEDGKGIEIRKGDRFTIPKGFIQISLDPAARTKLFRPGLKFYLKTLFFDGSPNEPQDLQTLIEKSGDRAKSIIQASDSLTGLDISDSDDAKEIVDRLSKNKDTREFYALGLGTHAAILEDAIKDNDTQKAAWAGYWIALQRAMTVVTDPIFEETLWKGYLANQTVYEAAAAAAQTPGEAEAIKRLSPLFQKLDEATLFAWINSGEPIGPKIGVNSLAETILLPLAQWHLSARSVKREEDRKARSERREISELKLKWLQFGLPLITAILGAIAGFLSTNSEIWSNFTQY